MNNKTRNWEFFVECFRNALKGRFVVLHLSCSERREWSGPGIEPRNMNDTGNIAMMTWANTIVIPIGLYWVLCSGTRIVAHLARTVCRVLPPGMHQLLQSVIRSDQSWSSLSTRPMFRSQSQIGSYQGLYSKDRPGQHSILSMLGIIFDKSRISKTRIRSTRKQ